VYVYDVFGSLAAEYSSAPLTTAPVCGTCYLSTDHLGSTRLVTGENGSVMARHDYLPFGEEIPSGYANRGADWAADDSVKQKFTGQERDSETQLDFFQARYFSAAQGRFNSPDPGNAGADLLNPQSWNAYSYVGNDPLSFVDPTGESFWSIFRNVLAVASFFVPGGQGVGAGLLAGSVAAHVTTGIQIGVAIAGATKLGMDMASEVSKSGSPNHHSDDDRAGIPPEPETRNTPTRSFSDNTASTRSGPFFTLQLADPFWVLHSLSLPYIDPFDTNHRLFGTHYCGPGGGGNTTGSLDETCKAHDTCYADAGLSANDNRNQLPAPKAKVLQHCNQQFCDATGKLPGMGPALSGWYFKVIPREPSQCR
jgi:RHS repeat-associated protein